MGIAGRGIEQALDYWIFSIASGELEKSAAAHVLARAYRDAWRAKNLTDPEGAHHFGTLDLVICYGGYSPPRVAINPDDVKPFTYSGRRRRDDANDDK